MTIELNSDTNGQIANANGHSNGTSVANGGADPDDHHHERIWWKGM
jgi:hypothetical protein